MSAVVVEQRVVVRSEANHLKFSEIRTLRAVGLHLKFGPISFEFQLICI